VNGKVATAFIEALRAAGFTADRIEPSPLAPAVLLAERPEEWRALAALARGRGMRWCGLWAQERGAGFEAFSCLERDGDYVVVRTRFDRAQALPSLADVYPAADRPERHARDLLGVRFADAPDARRWTRHRAWAEGVHPLCADFAGSAPHAPTPPDHDYPFVPSHGAGVVEIPVGPVHAGIIEPGHFRFQAVGETILNLEERLGYVHKGIEHLAAGRDVFALARLAGRVSGDCTVSHAWAACQAMERAAGVVVPERGLWIRAILAERERIANHLGDVGAICNDVGFAFAWYQLMRLKEIWIRENQIAFGHRLLMDRVVPGGASVDLAGGTVGAMIASARRLSGEVAEIVAMLENSESLEDRLMGTGRLSPQTAIMLGAVGYVGRAAGHNFDVRRDAPYAPYQRLQVGVPVFRAGDVAARAKVRTEEIAVSARLLVELLESLPGGAHRVEWIAPAPGAEGLGIVESWRGELLSYVRFGDDGRIARYFPRDPSWLTWPALELLVQDNIVPDFPVCNKSVNASYSGHDL
jgi:Ni,Fe-hydrogenase III large subunit/NADH:ubiquinone oxidoreductase subunit C